MVEWLVTIPFNKTSRRRELNAMVFENNKCETVSVAFKRPRRDGLPAHGYNDCRCIVLQYGLSNVKHEVEASNDGRRDKFYITACVQ